MNKSLFGQELRSQGADRTTAPAIAIIGAACRLPGAPNLDAFWELLIGGVDAVTEIPDERWNKARYLCGERGHKGKAYTFAAGVIDNVAGFDPAFFGISPREAEQMDPQQRLALELAHEAIEDAGVDGAELAGERVGVFVGGSSWDYLNLHVSDPAVTDAYSMTGATLCSLANRVSYAFDLRGPSFTVDTACSSSLVALHQACEALRTGEIPMALVGGISLLLAPQSFVGFCAASMLSPRGRCHAFDARADGYVRAEGGGFVMLKPLDAALAAGDPIRAVIRGTGVNSDGRTIGFSLPNKEAQFALLEEVYDRFGLERSALGYVEAHGTGTPAGDPIEAGALGRALARGREAPLPIGSVKTNIGHLEAGSGMAGLLKAMLIAERGVIPPSLHCRTPNPDIPFSELNLALVPEPRALASGSQPALIGINSFGFGGTNGHAVIEARTQAARGASAFEAADERDAIRELPPLLLSARSEGALHDLARWWHARLGEQDIAALAPLIRAQALRREQHKHRLAVAGDTATAMGAALAAHLAEKSIGAVATGNAVGGGVAFIFSGNGSQWAGMASDAIAASTAFRRGLEAVDTALRPWLGWSVGDALRAPDTDALRNTEIAQPLLFAIQVALVMALREAGVTPDAVAGHSVGEVAAAWASGALSLDQAARVITARSHGQQTQHGIGAMAVVGADAGAIELVLASPQLADSGVEIAAHNSGQATTIAGPEEGLACFGEEAKARGWRYSRLDLDYAFHSAAMDPIEPSLGHDLEGLAPERARIPFFSAVEGAETDGRALDAGYWWRNIREPVLFEQAARAMIARGNRIFVEIGPHGVVQAYLNDALRASEAEGRVVASLSRRPSKGDPIAELLARCHVAGADIRGNPAFHGSQDLSGLPRYPWQRERFWLPPTQEDEYPVTERDEHPLLGVRRGGGDAVRWSRHIGVELQPWLADHQVGGAIVVPAAALIDMALAAARARFPTAAALELIDLEIGRALVIEPGVLRELDFRIGAALDEFTLASRPRLEREPWTVHMSGRLAAREEAGTAVDWDLGEIGAKERILPGSRLYALAHDLGLDYGGAFRTVTQVEIASPQSAIVLFEEQVHLGDGYLIAPNLLDGALQGLLALAAGQLGSGTGVMPWRFGRIRLLDREACAPRSAQLRLTRVGPRSIRADVALIAADGRIVAELLECWFVRVALGGKTLGKDPFFRPVTVPSADGAALPLPSTAEILASIPAEGQSEAALLADAYASAAALEALRSAAPNGRINIDVMLGAGPTTPQGRALALVLLGWLQADGLAEQDESGSWAVGDELPPASAILQSLFFDTPTAGADVALLAAGAAALPEMILGGAAAALVAPALWEQLLYDSPSGTAAADRLIDAVERASVSLPIGRPLRILEIGARRGRLTQRLTDRLGERARIVAATDADDLPALTDALATRSTARAIAWEDAQDTGAFDLIIGLHALSFGDSGATIDAIRPLLAPNGIVLMAEPLPARAWSLMRADTAFRSGPQWQAALDAAGFQDAEARTLRTGLWPIGIIAARASTPLESEQPIPIEDLLLIGAGEHPLGERLRARLAATCATTIVAADALLPADSAARKIAILFDATHASLAEALAIIAQVAVMATDEVEREISLIVTAEASGDSYAAALTGARRVLVNEAANLRCRIIRLDRDLDRDEAATRAAAELAAPDGEDEISWSAAGRSVTRVRTGLPSLAAAAPDALRLSIERPGLLDSLAWQAATPAQPAANEIAIEIHATGLNFRDVMWAMGLLPDEALLDGYAGPTLGLECAGIVTAVGAEVAGFAQGDRVMAFAPASLGTHTVTAAHAALVIPEGMDFASAATVPVVFLTVAYALGQLAQLEAGETVLIHGGAGGVGLAAIQFAQARGARVFATAGSEPKRALLANLGVEAVLDSRSLSFADDVMRLTNGEGVDVVLNSLAGEAMRRSLALLKPFGRFLELGKRDFYENSAIGLRPLRHNISYFAVDADQLPVKRPALAARLLAEIGAMLREGALRPLPYRRFGLTAIEQAFRLMQGSGHIGKIVIERGATLPPTKLVPPPLSLPSDRTIVLTGGLDGFGKETARWLAAHGARHLALIGRRGPATPGANELLAELRFAAVDARPYTCDVADEASLARTLAAIRDEQAPIGGVVHAAVAMDDGLLMQLNAERFANALRPKLGGAELLDRLTRSDPVDLFILFSSVTTPLGNPGQANYVAANAAIEAIAEHRHAEGLPALAVQWGPIGDAGYLAREQGVSDLLARQLGGQHLSAREALDALPALLATGAPVAGFAPVRWSALRGRLPLLATTLFEEIGGAANDEGAEIDLRALIANASPEEAQAHVATMLIEEVARIMKLATDRIEPQRALAELGMDSLMAVELRLAVEQRFGISVPLLALSEGATVTAMAARIVRSMGGGEGLPPENVSTLVGRLARHERGTVEHDPADRLKRPAEHTFAAAAAAMP